MRIQNNSFLIIDPNTSIDDHGLINIKEINIESVDLSATDLNKNIPLFLIHCLFHNSQVKELCLIFINHVNVVEVFLLLIRIINYFAF